MDKEIDRLAEDLTNDEQLFQELTDFGGTFEELAGWLRDKGYRLDTGELAEIVTEYGDGLSDDALDNVAGGKLERASKETLGSITEEQALRLQMLMDRRSKAMQTLSNIIKKTSSTADAIISNIK
jgi:hypothetical protein